MQFLETDSPMLLFVVSLDENTRNVRFFNTLIFNIFETQVNLPVRIFPGMIVSYLRHSSLEKGRRLAREIRKEESAFNRGDASVETVEPRLTWDLW